MAGNALSAEAALFSLALLARDMEDRPDEALDYLRAYERRFPEGAFAPEVALGILETIKEQGQSLQAIEAAAAFERRFPGDPRAEDVALSRAEILCTLEGRGDEALALFDHLLRTANPEIRDRAYRSGERCRAVHRSHIDEAAPAWRIPIWERHPGG